jgi:hypothetical protein
MDLHVPAAFTTAADSEMIFVDGSTTYRASPPPALLPAFFAPHEDQWCDDHPPRDILQTLH